MIPLLDIQLATRLVALFPQPDWDVTWMPKDQGRRSAYTNYKENGTRGKSGITLFRTEVQKATGKGAENRPGMHNGYNNYRRFDDNKQMTMDRRREVDVIYDVNVWTYRQIHVDDACKKLMFDFIYRPLEVLVNGWSHPFTVDGGYPKYGWQAESEDETVRLYSLNFQFKVLNAFWTLDRDEYAIFTMEVNYHQITSGDPILLDQLILVPDPPL